MRLVITAVGRLKAGPERELAERYRERAGKLTRSIGLSALDIVEIDESRARRPEDRITQEGAALAALLTGDRVRIALDARGQSLTSEALADRLARWRDSGRGAAFFLIGGADGLAGNLKQGAGQQRYWRAIRTTEPDQRPGNGLILSPNRPPANASITRECQAAASLWS
jgi:23S rRNA (pseudouridine1915-N3)-methyltransferase